MHSFILYIDSSAKIFTFVELYLPRSGYANCAHLMNFMVLDLEGEKISFNPNIEIDFLDLLAIIKRKIN